MTQIFDNPADFADEALDGFVAANRGYVARVDGGVVRSTEMTPGQVALVIGGGSGHYPAFAGLVGPRLPLAATCSPRPRPGRSTGWRRRPTPAAACC
jgi:dihydroxyacetone kinase